MTKKVKSLPFSHVELYYSGSISGLPESDLLFPSKLVSYIKNNGAHILDPQVPLAGDKKAFVQAISENHGLTIEEWLALERHERDFRIYNHDINLVDKATHLVALLNGTSFGVGMELQRVFDKPHLGLPETPVLGLLHVDNSEKISPMITGATHKHKQFIIRHYKTLADAKKIVFEFLNTR